MPKPSQVVQNALIDVGVVAHCWREDRAVVTTEGKSIMKIYRHADCDVLAEMTTTGFEFSREIAHEQGIDLGVVVLGERLSNPASVMLLRLPPGHVLERHAHDTHRMEVVVSGSVITADGHELRSGDVFTSGPGEFYGPLTAGPEGCTSVEIFGDIQGMAPRASSDASPEHAAVIASIGKRTLENLDRSNKT